MLPHIELKSKFECRDYATQFYPLSLFIAYLFASSQPAIPLTIYLPLKFSPHRKCKDRNLNLSKQGPILEDGITSYLIADFKLAIQMHCYKM